MQPAELLERIVSLLFPQRCVKCDDVVEYDDLLCENCTLERTGQVALGFYSPICGVVALTRYISDTRGMVLKIKTGERPQIYSFIADKMQSELAQHWSDVHFDAIVPVPATQGALLSRGFNHADRLAQSLSEISGIPAYPDALRRAEGSQPQHALPRDKREANAEQSYEVGEPQAIFGKTVLLVDDIITTGYTAHVCATRLLDAGALRVYVLVAAATPSSEATL